MNRITPTQIVETVKLDSDVMRHVVQVISKRRKVCLDQLDATFADRKAKAEKQQRIGQSKLAYMYVRQPRWRRFVARVTGGMLC